MKTILWAAITANGAYMHGGTGYSWSNEVFEDYETYVLQTGNCIVGRKTYDEFTAGGGVFSGRDVVVVSRTSREIEGVHCVTSPTEALKVLEDKGYEEAFVAGGDSLVNAFLAENLGNEVVFNITPELAASGGRIALSSDQVKQMTLIEMSKTRGGIVKLRYSLDQ